MQAACVDELVEVDGHKVGRRPRGDAADLVAAEDARALPRGHPEDLVRGHPCLRPVVRVRPHQSVHEVGEAHFG